MGAHVICDLRARNGVPYIDPEKNREASRRWQAQKRDEMRAVIRTAKDCPCMDCQGSYPHYVMHFDHVRDTKSAGIAQMVQQPSRHKMEALLKEITKCEVVCANCHALRHGGQGKPRE